MDRASRMRCRLDRPPSRTTPEGGSAGARRPLAGLLLALALSTASIAGELRTPDGGIYQGELRDGRMHGQGALAWDSGARYEGGFEAGQMSGAGRLVLPDGSVMQGIFRNGALNGEGRVELPDGTVLRGWFRHGVLHGQGQSSGPDGRYEGAFRHGRYAGRGELALADGSSYRGEFRDGRFDGRGRFRAFSGEIYEGGFAAGQFSGQGVVTRPDGARHEGHFLRWRAHGPGRFTEVSGDRYEGEFLHGEFTGRGRIVRGELGEYHGEVRAWQPHGRGVLRMPNGDVYAGEFADGLFDGPGILSFARADEGPPRAGGLWRGGELIGAPERGRRMRQIEQVLYTEAQRLEASTSSLRHGIPGQLELYLLTLAGDGTQEVFRRETDFVRELFERDFGASGRALSLVNSRSTLARRPIATTTSLRLALEAIARRMNRDEDILFLYLTSHGSPDHQLSLTQAEFDLPDLPAAELARLLRESGIRWRAVVVSACYSGGFLDALRDEGTLVITAARHDRRSFGCADENDFTYFGRAYFKDALPASGSFQEAFRLAERLVRGRELELFGDDAGLAESDFSLPQMEAPGPISAQLARWWQQRSAARESAQAPREAVPSPSFSMR